MYTTAEILSGSNIKAFHIFGVTSKFTLACGNCNVAFKKRFSIAEIDGRFANVKCPCCGSVNEVPLYYNGEEVRLSY